MTIFLASASHVLPNGTYANYLFLPSSWSTGTVVRKFLWNHVTRVFQSFSPRTSSEILSF